MPPIMSPGNRQWHGLRLTIRDGAADPGTCTGWGTSRDELNLRIASVFIILCTSLIGVFLPMVLARVSRRMPVPKLAFFICKYVGSGVILATAFMHLLSPAVQALSDPCLSGTLGDYDWGHAICLMTIMVMFFIELMAARYNFGIGHSHGSSHVDPTDDLIDSRAQQGREPQPPMLQRMEQQRDEESGSTKESSYSVQKPMAQTVGTAGTATRIPGLPNDVSYPPGGADHLGHHREHVEGDSHAGYANQIVSLLILEFGVVFHSVFIGLSLAGTNDFRILLIVIAFHQLFEGLGLGSRLAAAQWPSHWKAWTGVLMAVGYAFTTPIGIAVGLGVNVQLDANPNLSQLVNGIFDAVSSGILIYTALVELLAHEFMFNPEMRDASLKMQLIAYGCVAFGVGIMALLAKWA